MAGATKVKYLLSFIYFSICLTAVVAHYIDGWIDDSLMTVSPPEGSIVASFWGRAAGSKMGMHRLPAMK